jgi:hypothetical protein
MVFVTGIWLILAATAYYKGKRNLALLALAAPLFMRIQYLILFDAPRGILAGEFLAVVAVACALWLLKDSVMKLAVLIALGGLGTLWDYATAFIIVPVFLYVLCQEWPHLWIKPRKTLLLSIASVLPPAGWLLLVHEWYSTHPYDLTATSVSAIPHLAIFLHNMRHFSSYLSFFAPALAPLPYVATALLCAFFISITVIAIRRRSYALFLSVSSLALLVCLSLSVPRASDAASGLYLSYPRIVIALPLAVWLLVLLMSLDKGSPHDDHTQTHQNNSIAASKNWLLVILASISFGVTQLKFNSSVADILSTDGYFLHHPGSIVASCQSIYQVYNSTNAQLFAVNDKNLAFGCAAQYDKLNTLEPDFDRRGWIIKSSYSVPIERILIPGKDCNITLPKSSKCTVESSGTILIQTPPTPAAQTLATVGLPVRFTSPPDN